MGPLDSLFSPKIAASDSQRDEISHKPWFKSKLEI